MMKCPQVLCIQSRLLHSHRIRTRIRILTSVPSQDGTFQNCLGPRTQHHPKAVIRPTMQQLASVCTLVNFVASGFLLPTYCRPSVAIAVQQLTSRVLRSIALVFDSSNLSNQLLSKSSTSSDHAFYSSPSSSTLIRRIHVSNHSHSAFGVSFSLSLSRFDVLSIACMLSCEVVPLR